MAITMEDFRGAFVLVFIGLFLLSLGSLLQIINATMPDILIGLGGLAILVGSLIGLRQMIQV